jgi:hypothetical protein
MKNLNNQRFHRLVVKELVSKESWGEKGYSRWVCICDCGNTTLVDSYMLTSGRTRSCGCLRQDNLIRHGHARPGKESSEYRAWQNMKSRCSNPNHPSFNSYGGRGIIVCDRWLGKLGFDNFLADMGEKPSPKLSLDRINNDGNYQPDNCRWTDALTQSNNQRPRGSSK